jgi:hypothetical protein
MIMVRLNSLGNDGASEVIITPAAITHHRITRRDATLAHADGCSTQPVPPTCHEASHPVKFKGRG